MTLRRLFVVLLSVVLAGGLGVLATCRLYWGHWFGPPSAAGTARQLESLHQFTMFWPTWPPACGTKGLARSAHGVDYSSGESPHGRLAADLLRRGLSPDSADCLPESLLWEVTEVLRQSGRLLQNPDVRMSNETYGDLAVGTSPDGGQVILAALTTSAISNDHYPYYEVAFLRTPTGELKVVRDRFYWYDISGWEGWAHWVVGVLAAAGVSVAWLLAGIVMLVKRLVRFIGRRRA